MMDGDAFTHLGNHLIADSASAINAGEDDESILDHGRAGLGGGSRRRRVDDDEETDVFDDDDLESMASLAVDGANGNPGPKPEEDVQLPPHACAYVVHSRTIKRYKLLTGTNEATVVFTILVASSNAWPATSGSAVHAAILLHRISSTTLFARATKRLHSIQSLHWGITSWNATSAVLKISFFWVSSPPSLTPSSCYYVANPVPQSLRPKT